MRLDGQDPSALEQAARTLADGGLVAFPTETVYGLGADGASDAAVAGIFAAKGRPGDHPLILHVADAAGVDRFAHSVPDWARSLMQAFWPGPLTLILPRREGVATAAAGGQASIGLRCPAHPVALALLRACASLDPAVHAIAGPSANRFGKVSPTTAAHVQAEFGADLMVLDGGPCAVGIESTIVDATRGAPVLLRPGVLTPAQLQAACGQKVWSSTEWAALTDAAGRRGDAPRASGTLESHYAPNARVRLMDATQLQTGLDLLGPEASRMAVYARSPLRVASRHVLQRTMPADAAQAAEDLREKVRGYGLGAREVFNLREGTGAVEACELGHDAAGVVDFDRDLHGWLRWCSRCSRASRIPSGS